MTFLGPIRIINGKSIRVEINTIAFIVVFMILASNVLCCLIFTNGHLLVGFISFIVINVWSVFTIRSILRIYKMIANSNILLDS